MHNLLLRPYLIVACVLAFIDANRQGKLVTVASYHMHGSCAAKLIAYINSSMDDCFQTAGTAAALQQSIS